MLITQAKHIWPDAITPNLWPYAVRVANKVRNLTTNSRNSLISSETFGKTIRIEEILHLHMFGGPAYVLSPKLQAGKRIDDWSQRYRVGRKLITPYF